MRVSLSTYGSREDVEPMVGLAVQSRALGAEVLARVGVPLVPIGQPVRPPKLVAARFDTGVWR